MRPPAPAAAARGPWSWDDWVYDPGHGRVVNREDAGQLIPYNYVVFNVSRYAGE